jgi:carboxymethylenebutenolidase
VGKVGAVGYCWGGLCTYWAACELPIAAASSYYGGGIVNHLDKTPRVPTIFHFGEKDTHIPLVGAVDKIREAYPAGTYHIYPAGHGFNCTERADYDPVSAALARERTLALFADKLG